MPTNKPRIHETNLELSQSVPPEVAVGTDIAVKVKVWCPAGCDLRGGSVTVKAANKTVATAELTECHDGRSETSGLTIKVPGQLGDMLGASSSRVGRSAASSTSEALSRFRFGPCRTQPVWLCGPILRPW